MFKDVLKSIMSDLDRIEKIDKNELFKKLISKTVDVSYKSYCDNLRLNYDYLLYRDTMKVMKTIKRERAKREKNDDV